MIYSIDRFEGDSAVLCDEEETCVTVPRASLPADVQAGDMLRQTADGYEIDRALTAARRARAQALRQRLTGKGR